MSQGAYQKREWLFALVCICLAGGWAGARESTAQTSPLPKLTYTKILKGSVPEYVQIVVEENGLGTYDGRALTDSPSPRALKLSPATTRRLFDLAGQLNNFRGIDLESRKKVANLGQKTFAYTAGGQENRVEFNYTQNREAQDLTDLFEKIASVEQHLSTLEYSIRYDPLGLPRELLQIQIDLENRALTDPELLTPALEKIAQNPRFLHIAQARAQDILKRVQSTD